MTGCLTPITNRLEAWISDAVARKGSDPMVTTILPNGAETNLSFLEVEHRSRRLSRYLRREWALPPGSVVGLKLPNCNAYPVAALGILRAGWTLSPINPLASPREAARQLGAAGARGLLGLEGQSKTHVHLQDNHPDIQIATFGVADDFGWITRAFANRAVRRTDREIPSKNKSAKRVVSLRIHVAGDAGAASVPLGTPGALLPFSGGTTGEPKGVRLDLDQMFDNIEQIGKIAGDTLHAPNQTVLMVIPMYHMFGLSMLFTALKTGNRLLLVPNPRPLSNLRCAMSRHHIDILPGVNTLFQKLLAEDWFDARHCPKLAVSGATRLDETVRCDWLERTGSLLCEAYGMTEATTVISINPPDKRHRDGAAGLPLPGTSVRIVSADGSIQPKGQPGEIEVSGPQVMQGYLGGDPKGTFQNDGGRRYLRTGDIGHLDEDNYLFITDRLKDMILVSGFNVFPKEVEDVLLALPGVKEVAVVGRPNADRGEYVVAFIVASDHRLTEDDVRSHATSTLVPYKRPSQIEFIDELPKSTVGKILKRELRDRL